jgi:hypothetical protein
MEYDRSLSIPAAKSLIAALHKMPGSGYTSDDEACVRRFIGFLQQGDTHKARRFQKSNKCTETAANFIDEILSDTNTNPNADFEIGRHPLSHQQGMSEALGTSPDRLLARTGMNDAHKFPRKDQTDLGNIPAMNYPDASPETKAYANQRRAARSSDLKAAIKGQHGQHHKPNLPEQGVAEAQARMRTARKVPGADPAWVTMIKEYRALSDAGRRVVEYFNNANFQNSIISTVDTCSF